MNNEKNRLIPDLRFPEFLDEGEWEEKVLRLLANKNVEKNKDGLINNVFTNSAIDGIIDQREYFDKDIADKNNLENYYIVKDGDYVYNPRISNIAPVGPISKNKTNLTGAMSPLYTVFRFINKNNEFYEYYFKSVHWYDSIRKASNTGARFDRMSITDSVFMNISVLAPNPKEQQKIASCLSSLDEVIAAHSQKLEVLKEHKKGLMQNLFPQEGETVPKHRFSEFFGDGEWVEKALGSVAEIVTGSTPSTIEISNYNGSRLFVSPADINDNRYIDQTKTTLSDLGFLKTRKISANSVLFVCIGSTIGKIAQNITECATNQQINALIPLTGNSSDFIYSLLDNNSAKIATIAGIHAVPIINKTSFSAVELNFPPSLLEQQKIASCFSSLDALMTVQTRKIKQLKLHKKGLMQSLFPKSITN